MKFLNCEDILNDLWLIIYILTSKLTVIPSKMEEIEPVSLNYTSILSIIGVALLWGATNPFIRKGSSGFNDVERKSNAKNILHKVWLEIKFLVSRWQVPIF